MILVVSCSQKASKLFFSVKGLVEIHSFSLFRFLGSWVLVLVLGSSLSLGNTSSYAPFVVSLSSFCFYDDFISSSMSSDIS